MNRMGGNHAVRGLEKRKINISLFQNGKRHERKKKEKGPKRKPMGITLSQLKMPKSKRKQEKRVKKKETGEQARDDEQGKGKTANRIKAGLTYKMEQGLRKTGIKKTKCGVVGCPA